MVSSACAGWAANVMSRKAAHATPTLHLGRKRSFRVIGVPLGGHPAGGRRGTQQVLIVANSCKVPTGARTAISCYGSATMSNLPSGSPLPAPTGGGAAIQLKGGAAIVAPVSSFPNGVPGNALVLLPLNPNGTPIEKK